MVTQKCAVQVVSRDQLGRLCSSTDAGTSAMLAGPGRMHHLSANNHERQRRVRETTADMSPYVAIFP
eukprot:421700-Amphidinium_carterae.2